MNNLPISRQQLGWLIVTIAIVVAGALGIQYPIPPPPDLQADVVQLGITNFDSVTLDNNFIAGGTLAVTGASTLTGAATLSDILAVTGAATFSNDVTIDDTINIDDTTNVLSGTQTLTPTATFYEFAPAASVLTLTLSTGSAVVGDLLILQNTVSTNTVIIDTTATVGGGNITLGANDLALFIYSNSKWIEIASPDNS